MATVRLYGANYKTVRRIVEELNDLDTMVDELIADHATMKTYADAVETLIEEMSADHAIGITWDTEVDADLDTLGNYASFLQEQTGVIDGNYTFAGTAAATALGAGGVRYRIGGEEYYVEAIDTTITLTGVTVVTGSNVRAWRVVIDKLGVITTESANDAGEDSVEKAMLKLGSVAQAANTCCLGQFAITAATGFTPATDNTSGEAAFGAYYERLPKRQDSALTAAMGSALTLGDGLATLNVGTADFRRAGLNLAQIAADATLAATDADTVTTTEAGGWLLLVNLAGTGFVTLSSDGLPGVSALTDTDAPTALVALNLLASRLPGVFVPLGYWTIVTANAATFTLKTTLWDATDITAVAVDQTFGSHDRTVAEASVLARESNPPAVPASVTAPLIATLTAPNPASPPATLSAAALDDFTFADGAP